MLDLEKSREKDLKRGIADATIYRIGNERLGISLSPGERGRVAMLYRIEALEWLLEVQTLYLMWMHSCVRLVQFGGWRSELSATYHKALRDAGYGGPND